MITKVKKIIGVAAGKGGVGKSTVAVNLALALKELGFSVGILDADIYGPSLMKMLEITTPPTEGEGGIIPGSSYGIACISMAFFNTAATIVRAPIANQVIHQFIRAVVWGELDFLVVDFPPGTGDIQLTLLQEVNFCGMVIVTTPQEVALIDVQKTVEMIQKTTVPICGVFENMSYFEEGSRRHFLFGQGGGKRLADSLHLPLLGEMPIDPQLGMYGDTGKSLFKEAPQSTSAEMFLALGAKMIEMTDTLAVEYSLLEGGSKIKIEWRDGLTREYEGRHVQRYCPCVICRDIKDNDVQEKVEMKSVTAVGKYALKIQFSRGCSSGIYPFAMLRKICS